MITARNPVHAALFLVLAFFTAAGIWLLLRAEFLAIALVLVYVGAVMVLFLFVVMMLDINVDALRAGLLEATCRWRRSVGALIALEMALVLMARLRARATRRAAAPRRCELSNTKALGTLLYTDYVYPLRDRRGACCWWRSSPRSR